MLFPTTAVSLTFFRPHINKHRSVLRRNPNWHREMSNLMELRLAFTGSPLSLTATKTNSDTANQARRTIIAHPLRGDVLPPTRAARITCSAQSSPAPPPPSEMAFFADGTRVLPVALFLRGIGEEKVSAVYAIMDQENELQFVGKTTDLVAAVKEHQTSVVRQPGKEDVNPVNFIRILTSTSEEEKDSTIADWLDDAEDDFPPGNVGGSDYAATWNTTTAQTTASPVIISPFAEDGPLKTDAPRQDPGEAAIEFPLDEENVDIVLDEVRPFLMADGGNVSVVSVDKETGEVKLVLEGACGTCASSTTTMKLGIEKVLKERFPDIGDITAVSEEEGSQISVESVQKVIDEVKGTIVGLGASVELLAVQEEPFPRIELKYTGPPKLAQGLELLLRDRLPTLEDIDFVDGSKDTENARQVSLVTPEEACVLKKEQGVRHVDVRTAEEFSEGHATNSVNIPWMLNGPNGLSHNANFLSAMREAFPKSDEQILVSCKMGGRSAKAATFLSNSGFTKVSDMEGGWIKYLENDDLPRE